MSPRYDTETLRSVVTIHAVLAGGGIEVPTRDKRMRCPIHRGDNETAFLFNQERFRCFVCDAHGDVFELAQRLHSLTFPQAVEHVARIAGVASSAIPRATREQIEQRVIISRRRTALRSFREQRLNGLAVELYDLDRAAETAAAALTAVRGTDAEDAAWDALGAAHRARDAAEYERCRLETNRERDWLDVLEQKRGGVAWAA